MLTLAAQAEQLLKATMDTIEANCALAEKAGQKNLDGALRSSQKVEDAFNAEFNEKLTHINAAISNHNPVRGVELANQFLEDIKNKAIRSFNPATRSGDLGVLSRRAGYMMEAKELLDTQKAADIAILNTTITNAKIQNPTLSDQLDILAATKLAEIEALYAEALERNNNRHRISLNHVKSSGQAAEKRISDLTIQIKEFEKLAAATPKVPTLFSTDTPKVAPRGWGNGSAADAQIAVLKEEGTEAYKKLADFPYERLEKAKGSSPSAGTVSSKATQHYHFTKNDIPFLETILKEIEEGMKAPGARIEGHTETLRNAGHPETAKLFKEKCSALSLNSFPPPPLFLALSDAKTILEQSGTECDIRISKELGIALFPPVIPNFKGCTEDLTYGKFNLFIEQRLEQNPTGEPTPIDSHRLEFEAKDKDKLKQIIADIEKALRAANEHGNNSTPKFSINEPPILTQLKAASAALETGASKQIIGVSSRGKVVLRNETTIAGMTPAALEGHDLIKKSPPAADGTASYQVFSEKDPRTPGATVTTKDKDMVVRTCKDASLDIQRDAYKNIIDVSIKNSPHGDCLRLKSFGAQDTPLFEAVRAQLLAQPDLKLDIDQASPESRRALLKSLLEHVSSEQIQSALTYVDANKKAVIHGESLKDLQTATKAHHDAKGPANPAGPVPASVFSQQRPLSRGWAVTPTHSH